MAKEYNDSFEAFNDFMQDFNKAIESPNLKKYIQKEAVNLRDRIMEENLIEQIERENNSANREKVDKYKEGNGTSIEGNVVTLYNDAFFTNDELTHFFNTENRDANYDGWSIAEEVEYGTGLMSERSSSSTKKGWVYKGDNDEDKVFTRGHGGKYIYQKLYLRSSDKLENWIIDYLNEELKEWE
jgi:hypothetical protein